MKASAAKTADRPVAARAWKSPWPVTLLEAYGGRLAIEATMEPSVTVSRNQGVKSASEQGNGPSQLTAENGAKTAPEIVIYGHFVGFQQLFDTIRAGCKNRAIILAMPPRRILRATIMIRISVKTLSIGLIALASDRVGFPVPGDMRA